MFICNGFSYSRKDLLGWHFASWNLPSSPSHPKWPIASKLLTLAAVLESGKINESSIAEVEEKLLTAFKELYE